MTVATGCARAAPTSDLKSMQGDLARLRKHWKQKGQSEGRTMGCSMTVEQAAAPPPPPPPRRSLEERVGAIERLIGLEAEEAAEQHAPASLIARTCSCLATRTRRQRA